MTTHNRRMSTKIRSALVLSLPALMLTGCYVMPLGTTADGTPQYAYSTLPVVPAHRHTNGGPPVIATGPMPATLNVRLYPANDLANQTGVLTGQVTNLMSGRGRFQFNYMGETLAGEATRVANDERRGIASAFGGRGTFAKCEYQMSTPYQGAGTCMFSNGAQYQVHIGT